MKYFLGFIAYILVVVIVLVCDQMALRFFHVYFPPIDVFLTGGIIFLLLLFINIYNEIRIMKQTIKALRSEIDELQKKPKISE